MHFTGNAARVLCLISSLCAVSYADEATTGQYATTATSAADFGCSCCDDCCDVCCCSACDQCDCCDFQTRFLGLLPSDHAFDGFISPLSNPFFFEDPRSLTEARTIYIYNRLPADLGPGGAQVWAEQLLGRLTERLSIIAPRLGNLDIQTQGNSSGFMSAPVGFKYTLVRDVQSQFLLTAGSTYFIPGSNRVYQGFGEGDFHFFLSGGKQFGNAHWISGSGFRIPANSNYGNQMWYWSNQWDYRLPGNIYPLIGLNWFHFMRSPGLASGSGGPGISALDLVNLPFGAVAGNDVVTCAIGARWKPTGNFEFGGGWEFPVTHRTDILQDRAYFDLILRY